MKKTAISLAIFLTLSLFLTFSVFAHSGCCSWHGGVRADGCGCNDGTPLSSTCAPYYTCTAPQQNTAPANTSSDTTTYTQPAYIAPTATPTPIIPTNTPTPFPTAKPTPTTFPTIAPTRQPTVVPTTAVLGAKTSSSSGLVGFLLVILAPVIIIGSFWWGRKISK